MGLKNRITQEEFIARCKSIHGDKYDYSQTKYETLNKRIKIGCPIHGLFSVLPEKHARRNQGCPDCHAKRLTQKEFMDRVKIIHENRYDFSKSIYIKSDDKVLVTCYKHGEFKIKPTALFRGKGCSKCGRGSRTMSTEEFIKHAQEKHGDKYDYSNVEFVNSTTRVNINCKKHGEFTQDPNNHIRGNGCPKCRNEEISVRRAKSNEDYLSDVKKIHGERYDYSKTNYTGNSEKIIVTCLKHGDFKISLHNHLYGLHGCTKCKISHGEDTVVNMLNELKIKYEIQVTFKDCKYKRVLPFDFKIYKNDDDFFSIGNRWGAA